MTEDWMKDAACRFHEPEMWFPFSTLSSEAKFAVRVCRRCPVQIDCLEYALDNQEAFGIWGGVMFEKPHRIDPELEGEVRESVVKAIETGWTVSQTSKNLHLPYQTVLRLQREHERMKAEEEAFSLIKEEEQRDEIEVVLETEEAIENKPIMTLFKNLFRKK